MSRAPTAEQMRAITTSGRDLCVVAGAGSGKTFVLTERVVHRVVRDGVPLRQVLAITFTEKAAAEMKHRLASALESATGRSARADVEAAAISTIHAFCARLLREFAVEAGVDPGFAVLDEVESGRRRRDALESLVAELAAADPAAFETLATLGGDDPAEALVSVWMLARESGGDVGAFVRRAADVPPLAAAMAELERSVEDLAGLPPCSGATGERVKRVVALGGVLPSGADTSPEACETAIGRLLAEVKLNVADSVKAALVEIREVGLSALSVAAEHALGPLRERLAVAVERLEALYEEGKGEGAELDFADLERRAVLLLEARSDVRDAVRARWPEVLVDEFQDVNPQQARLLALVATPRRFFVVGDPKQSIYGFRGADVSVFMDRLEHTRAADPDGIVELRTSFRSRQEVLAAVAAVFSRGVGGAGDARLTAGRVWAEGAPGDAKSAEAAAAPAAAVGVGSAGPFVELGVLPCRRLAEGRIEEMAWIADRIAAMCDGADGSGAGGPADGVSVDGASDARRGIRVAAPTVADPLATRPCAFGDVAVLLRATTNVKHLEAALVARDIPYAVVKGRGFYVAREVVDLAHLLAVVDDPRDDVVLAAVLRSPTCGLSDDGLFVLCAARGDSPVPHAPPQRTLSDVVGSGPCAGLSADDSAALARFVALLADLRARRAFDGILAIVERALDRTGLATLALGRPNGRQRAANLRKVREMARIADAAGRSLAEFVEDIADLRDREVREAEAATAARGAVTIMTVHGSKGLEFPVVFVPDIGRGERAVGGEVLGHARLGTGLRRRAGQPHDTAPFAHAAIAKARAAAESAEGERLLYVAMTRAAERLVLSGSLSERDGGRPWWDLVSAAFGVAVPPPEDVIVAIPGGSVHVAGAARTPVSSGSTPPRPRTLLARAAAGLAVGVVPPLDLRVDSRADAARLIEESARRAPVADGTPFQATVSALVAFDRCPQEYRLRHVIGVPETLDMRLGGAGTAFDPVERETPGEVRGGDDEDEVELSARAIGRAAHAALEELVPGFEGDPREAAREALTAETSGAPPEPGAIDRIARWVAGFRDGELGRAVRAVERRNVRREQAFLLRAGRTVIRGQIDLLWRGDGGTVVVDYKTSAATEPRREHRLQMGLYALAMRGTDGALPSRLVLWSLPLARPTDVPFGSADAGAIETGLLAEFARRTAQRDFKPRAAPPCGGCAYRERCGFSTVRS